MKIRSGFVSNSSSCSFCIMGEWLEEFNEELESKAYKLGLDIYSPPEMDGVYIGLDISKMGGDETKNQFSERAKKLFDELGIESNPSILSNAWYDG